MLGDEHFESFPLSSVLSSIIASFLTVGVKTAASASTETRVRSSKAATLTITSEPS